MSQDINPELTVAVVGMAGRFPGAASMDEFWFNLMNEKETISFFSDKELLESGVDPKWIANPAYVRARGVLGDSEYFDASFFGYSPREAEILDPQHRIFLETAWHAMEDAGYCTLQPRSKVGIFAGTGAPLYHLEISKNPHLQNLASGMSVIIANEKDYLTTRVSYKLNLTGSSLSLQCACSTSLTAIILGMQSLLTHQNDMVLAGGVSIYFPEKQGYLYEKGGLESPDGHCRTFDQDAQGTVFSSGAGVVVLKRLSDAMRDGDHIYCVLLGGSTNNDGFSKVSYTAPSVNGQISVELDTLDMAGVHPETISYVEAHGTATQLGDPIEIAALSQTFQQYTSKTNFCAIGSVKTNIGHTDVASGVIGLIKVILSMQNQTLPASLHFTKPNPQIDFAHSPFYVNTKTKFWNTPTDVPRRALLNSFGVGGSNACLIVQEPPAAAVESSERFPQLFVLSAKTKTALDQMSSQLLTYVKDHSQINLSNLCYTLQVGRALFEHRRFFSFANQEEFLSRLSNPSDQAVHSIACPDKNQAPIFLFPGQGNQYSGMGSDLYAKEPFFRKQVDTCCQILKQLNYEYDLIQLFFNPQHPISDLEVVHRAVVAQPALFIIEYALAQSLISLGILPQALIGHSIGEFVAACIANVMSLESALEIIAARGKMTQQLPTGSMLAVFASPSTLTQWIKYPNEIAVMNQPQLTVVSGPTNAIEELEKDLLSKNIASKRLSTSHAFHSHMMDALIPPLKEVVSKAKLSAPQIPIMSTVTGHWLSHEAARDPNYWAQHARKPVDFSSAIQRLLMQHHNFYVEVGPGHSLESAVKACDPSAQNKLVGLMRSSNNPPSEHAHWFTALGKIWAYGGNLSFENLCQNEQRQRISLPGYPFERQKFLLDFKPSSPKSIEDKSKKKQDISDWFYFPSWKKGKPLSEVIHFETDANCWIVFHNGDPMGSAFIQTLKSFDQSVYSVRSSDVYEQRDPFDFWIRRKNPDDYIQLIQTIKAQTDGHLRILHLWNLSESPSSIDCFYENLFLDQALINLNITEDLNISFVGNNIYNITNDNLDIFKSLMIGPCRVLKNEYPNIQSRLIDASFPASEEERSQLSRILIAENLYRSDEIVVAYRNFSRWLPICDPIYFPAAAQKRSLRDRGVYLITGGMGAIGLTLAEFIAENTQATIILLQRSLFLDRSEWESWLAVQDESDEMSQKIRKILHIESLGSSVRILPADISSLPQMQKIVDAVLSEYGAIHGVIHCAGVPAGGVISLKTPEIVAEVLKPKVMGTLVLDQVLQSQKLDFFISCSSMTAILGEKGQVDYCAANAFIDAFTNQRNRSRSTAYQCINWGAWDQIGMAANYGNNNILIYKGEDHQKPDRLRLRRIEYSQNEELYDVHLDLRYDWFISQHRLNQIPTLVGTSFFEFLVQYTQLSAPDAACIASNVTFISPLMFFAESDKQLKLKVSHRNQLTTFSFFSQSQEHLRGEVHTETKQNIWIDVPAIMKQMSEETDLKKTHIDDPDALLMRTARWRAAKKVWKGQTEWLAQIGLPSLYQHETKEFTVHPALLDFATAFCVAYLAEELYLPHSYGKVTILHPLENDMFCYSRQKQAPDGFLCLDLDLLDPTGKVLLRVENYSLKRISEHSKSLSPKVSIDESHANILPPEGKEAFKRFFYQDASAQMIICAKDFDELIRENQPSIHNKKTPAQELQVKHPRPQLFTAYMAPTNEVEKTVAGIWENLLGINGLGIDDNFIELGGNSLTAIQVVGQLTSLFKVEFNVDSFLGNPTIKTTADFIIQKLINTLDESDLNELLSHKD